MYKPPEMCETTMSKKEEKRQSTAKNISKYVMATMLIFRLLLEAVKK